MATALRPLTFLEISTQRHRRYAANRSTRADATWLDLPAKSPFRQPVANAPRAEWIALRPRWIAATIHLP